MEDGKVSYSKSLRGLVRETKPSRLSVSLYMSPEYPSAEKSITFPAMRDPEKSRRADGPRALLLMDYGIQVVRRTPRSLAS